MSRDRQTQEVLESILMLLAEVGEVMLEQQRQQKANRPPGASVGQPGVAPEPSVGSYGSALNGQGSALPPSSSNSKRFA